MLTTMAENNNLQLSQLDATMAEAAQMATDGTGVLTAEAKEKLDACLIDMKAEYPENKFLFSVDNVPVITQSDIHTIGAKQKGGKTSLVSILISAAIAGQWNRVKCLDDDISVLYVDTEMKKVDTQQLGLKAARMAGIDADALAEHVHMVNFRPLTPEEMKMGISYFINVYKPKLVIIDGIVDLCSNFNDVEASQNLVLNFLMKMAEEHQCAIINVLHTNKTDGYTELRGHLGAFFEQKGATVIKCDKDDNSNIVTVTFPTHRYAPVPEFHFTFGDDGIPVCADTQHQEIEVAKQQSREEKKAADKQAVYEKRSQVILSILVDNGGSMERKALVDAAKSKIGKKQSTINSLIAKMKKGDDALIVEEDAIIKMNTF